ncbi:putative rRNA biogenesis protein [Trypanosoma theileri]|uniref:Putative rRNA biogenesis protein n=1 Tax=Trypanosoma theileri TaxID=67003 RepID=A0A1X0NXS8_9TRYP|nr:putative rRNA biogenesis protein [Trypanosoma theileri]ORC89019.1 putative rRNA biogenesis protein [Trypanosoma theileri]
MLFRDYRVHHAAADGIVVQLPGNGGFGKITRETLGGDALAERLFKRLASREHVRAVARPTRDEQQYRLLSVQLRELWSDVVTYASPVAALLPQLFRKHVLLGLGTTTMACVVKSTPERGAVLSLAGGMAAVAALENIPADAGSVEVRLLNYDVNTNVANVTARTEVVERTPSDMVALQSLLSSVRPGSVVSCTVLLSCTDDHSAIVEVPCGESSLLGYYIYQWGGAAKSGEPPVVGSCLQLTVEFVPEEQMLQEVLPFLVLSSRRTFSTLPAVRSVSLSLARTVPTTAAATKIGTKAVMTGLIGNFPWRDRKRQHQHPESDTDDSEDEGGAGRTRDGVGEGKMRKRKLEEAIDAYERSMETTVPSSPDEFQRLLLASPNNSYLWVQWMAHHVGLQQYEEGRLVAEKALRTIGVRESQELLNVWVAYMNLENLHGTPESLAAVFQRAVRRAAEERVVYDRLADIYAASRRTGPLLALCRAIVSKFRSDRTAWERLATTLLDQSITSQGTTTTTTSSSSTSSSSGAAAAAGGSTSQQLKRVLREMSAALPRDEYARAVVHIALHAYRRGDPTTARALLDALLARAPKKSDVWAVYIDQETSRLARREPDAAVPFVRGLLERAVASNFPARVMQQFLTRFMAFERVYGTPADVEKVRTRARSYVEAKIHASVGNTAPTTTTTTTTTSTAAVEEKEGEEEA